MYQMRELLYQDRSVHRHLDLRQRMIYEVVCTILFWLPLFAYDSITVSYTRELTSVSMRYLLG